MLSRVRDPWWQRLGRWPPLTCGVAQGAGVSHGMGVQPLLLAQAVASRWTSPREPVRGEEPGSARHDSPGLPATAVRGTGRTNRRGPPVEKLVTL
jgi:hypothetical protein